jgi:hypothetical protein
VLDSLSVSGYISVEKRFLRFTVATIMLSFPPLLTTNVKFRKIVPDQFFL